ncbi:unnamed protein product, partial [Iphiclides podalirius]
MNATVMNAEAGSTSRSRLSLSIVQLSSKCGQSVHKSEVTDVSGAPGGGSRPANSLTLSTRPHRPLIGIKAAGSGCQL